MDTHVAEQQSICKGHSYPNLIYILAHIDLHIAEVGTEDRSPLIPFSLPV